MEERHNTIRFDGRAVLVTGAARGIGKALAEELARRGASVVVADNGSALDGSGRSSGSAEAVARELRSSGFSAQACAADLATAQGVEDAVATCLDRFGRIDAIAHVASPCPDLSAPEALDEEEMALLLAVNPVAALRMAKLVWPRWVRQGYGRLLLTPSAALYGAHWNAPYATAKSALIGLTRCLAVDGANSGIRVNAMMPAAHTRMTEHFLTPASARQFARDMAPEKVAAAATWLLSEACNVSGEVFAIAGGRVARMSLLESHGASGLAAAEAVASAMPSILGEEDGFRPANLSERSNEVARILGSGQAVDIAGVEPPIGPG